MTEVSKADLSGQFTYTWHTSPGDNPNVRGKIDRDKLSTKEGYEVLDFINQFIKTHYTTLSANQVRPTVWHIEKKMHQATQFITSHLRTEYTKWIVDNWKN